MKTKKQIIEETASYYIEDCRRRAVQNSKCQYITSDGRMCALGRYMLNPHKYTHDYNDPADIILAGDYDSDCKVLVPEVCGHSVEFWVDLQSFHDNVSYWNNNGISEKGREYLKFLKTKYDDEA